MTKIISCEVHRIVFPKWVSVSEERKERIWDVISDNLFMGDYPNRKGFVGVRRLDNVIAGFFAHEDERQSWQYDNRWHPTIQSQGEFEHLFFSLFLKQGQIVIQRKSIDSDFFNLNLSVLRKSLIELLGFVLKEAGFPSKRIVTEEFRIKRTKVEMHQIFFTYPVKKIKVKNLVGSSVPKTYKLFNPDVDKDQIYREIFNNDAHEINEIWARTKQKDGDLRKTILAKAAIQAGQTDEIQAIVENETTTFRRSQQERFRTQFSSTPVEGIQTDDMIRIIRRVTTEYFIPQSSLDDEDSPDPIVHELSD